MRRGIAISLSAALGLLSPGPGSVVRAEDESSVEDQLEDLEAGLADLDSAGDEESSEIAARIDGAGDGDPVAPLKADDEDEPEKVEGTPIRDFKGGGSFQDRGVPALGKDEQPAASQAGAGPLGGLLSTKTLVAGGGALAGAMAGFMIAGPFGALIGAAIGLAGASLAFGFFGGK